jgi:AAA+ superfamily predicted ATPase
VTIKNVVVPLEIEYLQEAAKKRGISRTKLVRVVMERVVKDELVLAILDDDDQVRNEPRKPKYRRFRERNPDRDRTGLHHPISAQSLCVPKTQTRT